MTKSKLLLVLVAAASLATPALAGSRQGLPLDPQLLPPNSAPGDCVVRRVTGPGGAYRWERIECDSHRGWSSDSGWGYGRNRLEVETRDGRPPLLGGYDGDRYGHGDRYAIDRHRRGAYYDRRIDEYEHERSRAYDSGYVGGGYAYSDGYAQGSRREDRYGPAPAYIDYGYGGAAGRDRDGYLVWPGKLP